MVKVPASADDNARTRLICGDGGPRSRTGRCRRAEKDPGIVLIL
jgi:hypothetical protein